MVEDASEQEQVTLTGKMIVPSLQPYIAAPHHNPGNQAVRSPGVDALDAGHAFLVGQKCLRFSGVFK